MAIQTPRHPTAAPMLSRTLPYLALIAAFVWPTAAIGDEPAAPDASAFFDDQIKPLLTTHCLKCHGGEGKANGGLFLTSRERILQGGDSGPAVSLDTPHESLLLEAVNYSGYEMPPSGKLPADQIALLTRWIEQGLPWGSEARLAEEPAEVHGPPPVDDAAKAFWSFRPVAPRSPPALDNPWVRTPIDAFVLDRLQQAGLQPAPPADKTALLRRAYYDLIGLPPSPDEVAAFLADESPGAFERVVDTLLESPHYGERWGRHWLDLVRYAETNSYERDGPKPFVWRYRDYVIRSFNDDKPYDQFVTEQLAGDELDEVTHDSIIATGYYRLGIWQDEPVDPEQELYEDLDDLVRTTGEVFLGLTIGCARCHDHKIDPLPQTDYYRMLAFFRNVRRFGVRSQETINDASVRTLASDEDARRNQDEIAAHQQQLKEARAGLDALNKQIFAALVGVERDDWKTEAMRVDIARRHVGAALTQEEFDRYVELTDRHAQLSANRPAGLEKALCVKEHGRDCPPTHVLVRGNAHAAAAEVQPGFPSVLSPPEPHIEPPADGIASTGRRRALARWIVSPDNPLTARVLVNRVWHYHFGRGLVRSTSDFGYQGIAPTHPELLDWLAADFTSGGWRLKRLHKLIMLSSTYQMSASATPSLPAATAASQKTSNDSGATAALPGNANTPGATAGLSSSADTLATAALPTSADNLGTNRLTASPAPGATAALSSSADTLATAALPTSADNLGTNRLTASPTAATPTSPLDIDPQNDLLWRFDMRRLSAEEIRDSILAVNGSLNRAAMFGPSVYVTIPDEVLAGQSMPGSGWGKSTPDDSARRTIYIHVKRSLAVPLVASFDGPETDASCPARFVTTQPTQALGMLNSAFVNEQAQQLAAYLRQHAGDDPAAQVRLALERLFQRRPTAVEIDRGQQLLAALQTTHGLTPDQALKQLCVALYNLNEFIYLD